MAQIKNYTTVVVLRVFVVDSDFYVLDKAREDLHS